MIKRSTLLDGEIARARALEAVVLMHEMGHSIGIGKLVRVRGVITEAYDPDMTSVMAKVNPDNCNAEINGEPYWHYSNEYWPTRNMEYY